MKLTTEELSRLHEQIAAIEEATDGDGLCSAHSPREDQANLAGSRTHPLSFTTLVEERRALMVRRRK